MSLSEHIKQKRKKNGLSQVELAERAGVGLRFVRDLEQGKQTLRMDKVNDVLALREADCSVAMASGSDAAAQDDKSAPWTYKN